MPENGPDIIPEKEPELKPAPQDDIVGEPEVVNGDDTAQLELLEEEGKKKVEEPPVELPKDEVPRGKSGVKEVVPENAMLDENGQVMRNQSGNIIKRVTLSTNR